jgi:hypothetical protein
MTAETDRLIKGTYETDKTICGVRKIYRNNSRWSVVVPLLIRQRSEYQNEKTVYTAINKDTDTMFVGLSMEDLQSFISPGTRVRKRTIGKVDSRITIPTEEIHEGFFEDVVESAIEWHKEYNIMRVRPALPEDIYESRYASRRRRDEQNK